MQRRTVLGGLGAGLAALAGCVDTPGDSEPTTGEAVANGSFEDGLTGWTVGRDLPADPNKETGAVDATATTTTETASDGERALALAIDGSQDDGTLWVQQPVDLGAVETVGVAYRTVAGGANTVTKAAVYAGPERTLGEADFDVGEPIERADGGDWQRFEYDVDHDGTGLVAVGITVVWETEVTRLLDAVGVA